MRCLGCQYDLAKLSEHRCPECGRAFDPNDSMTFARVPRRSTAWHLTFLTFMCYGAALLLSLLVLATERKLNFMFLIVIPFTITIITFPLILLLFTLGRSRMRF